MKSPFPGMDPYLERSWRHVHSQLVAFASVSLNATLPEDLIARTEERVVVDSIDYEHPRAIYPDVRLYNDPNHPGIGRETSTATAVAEPIILEYESEEHTEPFITILDSEGNDLVTAIEFMSPTTKAAGTTREQYRQKRGEFIAARANIVEIDLVRAGRWEEMLAPYVAPARVRTAYRVVTHRMNPKHRVELYPISLREPLPVIPIPLRARDPDATLNLQSLIEQVYQNGRYNRTRYDRDCVPPLDAVEAVWADELLRSSGQRTS